MAHWFLLIGVILVVMAFASHWVEKLPVSAAIVYLLIGWSIGPAGSQLISIDAPVHGAIIEVITEVAVLISLFAVGLKLRIPRSLKAWRIPLRLAGPGMVISIGLTAVLAHLVFGLPWAAALLVGAVLAPTDPVLASEVQIRSPEDRDAVRLSLTAEGGLNDGMAFPVVLLALGWMGLHELGAGASLWIARDLFWAVLAGLGIGWICGAVVARLVGWLRNSGHMLEFEEFLVFGVIGLAYGSASLLHCYGFLAVFAAGLTLRKLEERPMDGPANPALASRLLTFTSQSERLCEVGVVLLVGALLAWLEWSLALLLFVVGMLLLVRPLAVVLSLLGISMPASQRRLVAWFGIRGVGSLYYLAYAITHGVPDDLAKPLVSIVIATLAASVCVHGISAAPLMKRYDRAAPKPVRSDAR